jgi:hypothetical protein
MSFGSVFFILLIYICYSENLYTNNVKFQVLFSVVFVYFLLIVQINGSIFTNEIVNYYARSNGSDQTTAANCKSQEIMCKKIHEIMTKYYLLFIYFYLL